MWPALQGILTQLPPLTNLPWEENLPCPGSNHHPPVVEFFRFGTKHSIKALKKNGQITSKLPSCPHQSVILGFHINQMQTPKTWAPAEWPYRSDSVTVVSILILPFLHPHWEPQSPATDFFLIRISAEPSSWPSCCQFCLHFLFHFP